MSVFMSQTVMRSFTLSLRNIIISKKPVHRHVSSCICQHDSLTSRDVRVCARLNYSMWCYLFGIQESLTSVHGSGWQTRAPFAVGNHPEDRQLNLPAVWKWRPTFLVPPGFLCSIYVFNCLGFGLGPFCVWSTNRNTWSTLQNPLFVFAVPIEKERGVLSKHSKTGIVFYQI